MDYLTWVFIVIGVLVFILLIWGLFIMRKNKRPTDYYAFFWMGITWLIIGIPLDMYPLSVIGLLFAIYGFVHKDKWKTNRKTWKDLSKEENDIKP